MKEPISIQIIGAPKSGKTAIAQQIKAALVKLGVRVINNDPQGTQTTRPKAIFPRNEVQISHVTQNAKPAIK